jgi:hypothetical protein
VGENDIFAFLVMKSSRGARRRGREMDMSIPLILVLAWGGTALVTWGVCQIAFKCQPKAHERKSIEKETGGIDEIKNLQRELRRL